jgi:GNAT superfamily N-acetyltransferase
MVREAGLEDVEQVVAAYEWLFAPPGSRPPGWDPERAAGAVRRAVASDAAVVLAAALDDELVGLCTAYDDIESVRFGRRVWVEDLAVHPDRRSLGVGKQLLDEAKRWARSRGATHLELDSAETRADAHRFYEREEPSSRSLCFGWDLSAS